MKKIRRVLAFFFVCSLLSSFLGCGGDTNDPGTKDSYTGSYGSVFYGGQTYNTVVIGRQRWMAENLNYNAPGSKCYNNSESNCNTYGRLYNWETAKTVCPSGWHLPSREEWDVLGSDARKLKATSFGGTDEFGFSALPGSGLSVGSIGSIGDDGYWWSASEGNSYYAYYLYMYYDIEDALWYLNDKSSLLSVRCLQD